jgi:IS30 family transposase
MSFASKPVGLLMAIASFASIIDIDERPSIVDARTRIGDWGYILVCSVGKYGIFVRRSIVYIFACFTPFSCRIKGG